MEQEKPTGKISTICRYCVFATFSKDEQTGCKFNRLYGLSRNGAVVFQMDDGEKKYFSIEGRFCNLCRNSNWGQKHPKRKWKQIAFQEAEIHVDVIINVENSTAKDIKKTLDSVKNQILKAKSVCLVGGLIEFDDVLDLMQKSQMKWQIEENMNVNTVLKHCKSTYYTIFDAGQVMPENYLYKINQLINVDMKKFCVITPDDNGQGGIAQNIGLPISELVSFAKDNHEEHMVLPHQMLEE